MHCDMLIKYGQIHVGLHSTVHLMKKNLLQNLTHDSRKSTQISRMICAE